MTLLPPLNYQEHKKNNLAELLKEFNCQINWTWIGNGSRRKVTFQIDGKNRLGFFAPRSHNLIEIETDESAEEKISALILPLKKFLKTHEQNFYTQVTATLFDNGLDLIFSGKKPLDFSKEQKLVNFAKENDLNISYRQNGEVYPVLMTRKNQLFFPDFKIALTSDIFIQATKGGLAAITKIIRNNIKTNSRIADIYAGFGAYSFAIYDLAKSVLALEGDKKMTDLTNQNASAIGIAQKIKAQSRDLFSTPLDKNELKDFDQVIINPPRNGATPQVVEISKSNLKNLIYVSCNPQSFKRDAKILIDSGFRITSLDAIDQFFATEHLELVAIFQK